MPLTTLPTKIITQISKLLQTRTPNTHAILQICPQPSTLQVLSPLLIPITLQTKAQEDTLSATFTPADSSDKTLLRRLRRCGLIVHARLDVTPSPLQNTRHKFLYLRKDPGATVAAGEESGLPKEVFVDSGDMAGVFFADHVVEGGGFCDNVLSFVSGEDALMDVVWGVLLDRGVNFHVLDRGGPLQMVAGGRRVGVVRVLLAGRDGDYKDV